MFLFIQHIIEICSKHICYVPCKEIGLDSGKMNGLWVLYTIHDDITGTATKQTKMSVFWEMTVFECVHKSYIFRYTTNSKNFNVIQFKYESQVNASDLLNATHSFLWHLRFVAFNTSDFFFSLVRVGVQLGFIHNFCVSHIQINAKITAWLFAASFLLALKCEIRTITDIKTMNLFFTWHWNWNSDIFFWRTAQPHTYNSNSNAYTFQCMNCITKSRQQKNRTPAFRTLSVRMLCLQIKFNQ